MESQNQNPKKNRKIHKHASIAQKQKTLKQAGKNKVKSAESLRIAEELAKLRQVNVRLKSEEFESGEVARRQSGEIQRSCDPEELDALRGAVKQRQPSLESSAADRIKELKNLRQLDLEKTYDNDDIAKVKDRRAVFNAVPALSPVDEETPPKSQTISPATALLNEVVDEAVGNSPKGDNIDDDLADSIAAATRDAIDAALNSDDEDDEDLETAISTKIQTDVPDIPDKESSKSDDGVKSDDKEALEPSKSDDGVLSEGTPKSDNGVLSDDLEIVGDVMGSLIEEANSDIVDIVETNTTVVEEQISPSTQAKNEFDSADKKRENQELRHAASTFGLHTSKSTNQNSAKLEAERQTAELHELTVIRDKIKELEATTTGNPKTRHKQIVTLKILKKKLDKKSAKKALKREAKTYHKGDVFEAEKSLIHTFLQAHNMGMNPKKAADAHKKSNFSRLKKHNRTKTS